MVSEWKKINMKGNIDILTGYAFSSSNFNDEEGIPLIRIRDLETHNPKTLYKGNYDDKYIINKGDILIGMDGEFNTVRWKGPKSLLNQRVAKIKSLNPHIINNEFIFYRLQIELKKIESLTPATTVKHLSKKDIENLTLILPPEQEQRKIAAILSSVDEAIEKTEAIIEQTEKVKKGLMQQLLTKGIGHTKFKKTEIGEIPEEWEVKRLDEIAKVSGGKRLPKGKSLTSVKNDHPYIRVADMQEDGISLENIQYVPTDVAKSIRRYTVNAGDIYISVAGTLGLVGIVPPELDGANLTENADRISNIKCNNIFLKYVLQSDLIQSIIEREKTISAQPKLALTRIKGFLIPIPSVEEQKKIADILLAVEKKLKSEKQKHVQLLLIKKGLMQVLLTGKVRVKVDDEVVSS